MTASWPGGRGAAAVAIWSVPFFLGCALADPLADPTLDSKRDEAVGLRAQGVVLHLDVARGTGQVTVRGDQLTADRQGGQVEVVGNASLEVDGPMPLAARAERIAVQTGGPVLQMSGQVRARLTLPQEADHRDH